MKFQDEFSQTILSNPEDSGTYVSQYTMPMSKQHKI